MLRCLAHCQGGGAVFAAFDGAVSYGMARPLAGGCGVSRVACGLVTGSLRCCCGVSAHVHETRRGTMHDCCTCTVPNRVGYEPRAYIESRSSTSGEEEDLLQCHTHQNDYEERTAGQGGYGVGSG
ncbi:hypothetical protein E2C01_053483 [Portunus trituberculatus]|uniref:Uncharacterized protein n=1 Tax=Portunus trituberculatus TaxID=210409 RepID=A0A5B7GS75_PORTR|nr:hypothetical protein [Portunus trituberculatus]